MAKLIQRNPFDESPRVDSAEAPSRHSRQAPAVAAAATVSASVTRRINFDVPLDLHRKLRVKSAAEGVTIAEIGRRLLEEWAAG